MSGGFLGVAHASRVLAGVVAISIFFCPSSSGLPEANDPAGYLCAFFAGFVRCMVILRN